MRCTFQLRIRFSRLGVFSRICRNSCVSSGRGGKKNKQVKSALLLSKHFFLKEHLLHIPSSSSRVTVGSTYSHQCLPAVDTGISQLDHLQARWMHTQATTGGLYCRQNVVKCRLYGMIRPRKKANRERENRKSVY